MKTMDEKIRELPSLKEEALRDIIKGMDEGKPLLGAEGLLTRIGKELIQISFQGERDAHVEGGLEEGQGPPERPVIQDDESRIWVF